MLYAHPPASHFFDSGAYVLHGIEKTWTEYRAYMDKYAAFVKKYAVGIDHYANVDVIGDPERSWKHLKYLEREHGLKPVPVVHQGSEIKWLVRYLEAGYDFIGLSGISNNRHFMRWLDAAFTIICNTSTQQPAVRTHGFGIGGWRFIIRYPWYSVDTTRWLRLGARGYLVIPRMSGGRFDFTLNPLTVRVGTKPDRYQDHLLSLTKPELAIVRKWLEHIRIPLEELQTPLSWSRAYLFYYEALRAVLPRFPSVFTKVVRKDLFTQVPTKLKPWSGERTPVIIYYSGNNQPEVWPEVVLHRNANLMLSFADEPSKRFATIVRTREKDGPVPLPLKKEKVSV